MDPRSRYPVVEIEARWQAEWREGDAPSELPASAGSRSYVFAWPHPVGSRPPSTPAAGMLPSPEGLDLSSARAWALGDTWTRFERHRGRTPILALTIDGFSAAAPVKAGAKGISAASFVDAEAAGLVRIGEALGAQFTGSPVLTSDPAYYRITQWIFLQLFAKRLAVRRDEERCVCKSCSSDYRRGVLAACPRCGGELADKVVTRWSADLTPYGDRLIADLDRVDSSTECASLQRGLLARCRGSEVTFPVSRPFELEYSDLTVFTTRIESIFGVTFLAVDPHHPILEEITDPAYEEDIVRYRERLRKGAEPAISGVRTGGFALNPANLKRIPILATPLANEAWSDGAVMAIPAHHAAFFDLARRLKLPIREVIHNDKAKLDSQAKLEEPWLGDGVLTNSGSFTSLPLKVGRDRIISFLSKKGVCRKGTRYRLRSLPLSTPLSWGAPVPVVHCKRCGPVPVPDSDLPVELPAAVSSGTGDAALPGIKEFVRARCPRCNAGATRDTDTILPWLGEAWSILRLVIPELAGKLEGFRDLAPGEAGQVPAAPDLGPAPASAADIPSFPEDVDVFRTPEEAVEAQLGPPDEARSGEVGAEEISDAPPANTPPVEPPPLDVGAPGAPGEPSAGAPSAGAPATEPEAKASSAEREGEPRGKGRSGRRAPSDEPETITPQSVQGADEEEDSDDLAAPLSPLRPFTRARVEALLPADMCLGTAFTRVKDVIGMRYVTKVLKDLGHLPFDEPFLRYRQVGRVEALPPPGEGSESVQGPLLEAGRFGVDALRLAFLFAAPPWKPMATGARVFDMIRFIDRIWRQMALRRERGKFVSRKMLVEKHRLIHDVTLRLSKFKLHTAVAALMRFVRFLEDPETAAEDMDRNAMSTFVILLSPFTPHLAEELWLLMGGEGRVQDAPWPVPSDELIHPPEREFAILVDGKVRDRMVQPSNLEAEKLESRALQRDRIRELVGSRRVKKVVVVPQRLVSIALEA